MKDSDEDSDAPKPGAGGGLGKLFGAGAVGGKNPMAPKAKGGGLFGNLD